MIYEKDFNTIKPKNVYYGTVIFVCIEQIEKFFKEIHPEIANPYVLITHNGDGRVDEEMINYLDNKIIKWYAMSVLIDHPKIIPIPAGLENLNYYNNGVTKLFNKYRKEHCSKYDRILFGFTVDTNRKERQPAYNSLVKNPLADEIKEKLNADLYLQKLNKYKFVAAPPGNAIESHRIWEAMYLDVVPIVKRSTMMEKFKDIGLPIWIIDDWDELKKISEEELEEKYNIFLPDLKSKALYMDYWIDLINNQ